MYRILALSVLVLAAAAPARAATLSTSSFLVSNTQSTWCNLTNLGKKPVSVTMDHIDLDANVLNTFTIEIQPESSDTAAFSGFGGLIRCRFSGKFSPKTVRAVALVLDGVATVLSVPAE
jgi:hypothetical protein